MDDSDLITRADAGRAYGVSRQAVEQALGRALNPPPVVMKLTGGVELYRRGEFHEWWMRRADDAWQEKRQYVRGPSKQLNCRISDEAFGEIAGMRGPGQTMSMMGRELIMEALAARRGVATMRG